MPCFLTSFELGYFKKNLFFGAFPYIRSTICCEGQVYKFIKMINFVFFDF